MKDGVSKMVCVTDCVWQRCLEQSETWCVTKLGVKDATKKVCDERVSKMARDKAVCDKKFVCARCCVAKLGLKVVCERRCVTNVACDKGCLYRSCN